MGRIDKENAKAMRQAMDVLVTIGDEEFDNDSLISVTVTLRGPHRELSEGNFTLESSQIDITARVDGDDEYWATFVSEFDDDEVITYSAGYLGDEMSEERSFYMQDAAYDSRTKTLTVSGCDRTIELLEKDYSGAFIVTTYANIRAAYYDAIKDVLDDVGVEYEEAGTVPSGTGTSASTIFFDTGKARDIIAATCGIFRNSESLSITYRDAGRPQLIAGDSVVLWEVNLDDLVDYEATNERNVKEFDIELSSYQVGSTEELASLNDCVANTEYFAEVTDPVYDIGSCTNCTAEKLGLHSVKVTCTTSGTCTVNGRKIVKQTLDSDAPRVIADSEQKGIVVDLGSGQLLSASTGSLTALAVDDLLQEPTVKYTFKYRGDPRMQPCDIVRIVKSGGSPLYPDTELYPDTDVYPMESNTKDLRISTITLEHTEGGLTSTIEAREDSFYSNLGSTYPSLTLYPNTDLYPN